MTLQEYMDAERFPWTTQPGLDPSGQLMIDAFNYDQMREYLEEEGTVESLDAEQPARWAELGAKIPEQSRLLRELRQTEKANGGGAAVA
jgi:hypothetical protein